MHIIRGPMAPPEPIEVIQHRQKIEKIAQQEREDRAFAEGARRAENKMRERGIAASKPASPEPQPVDFGPKLPPSTGMTIKQARAAVNDYSRALARDQQSKSDARFLETLSAKYRDKSK